MAAALPLVLGGCTNIDCPLDNLVELTCGLYSAETGSRLVLTDTLTVSTGGARDTVLNRAQDVSSFVLPVRQGVDCDTLQMCFSNASGQSAIDTLFVWHTNEPHFESVDCPAAVFHTLQKVAWTSHALRVMPLTIDSAAIVRETVNYDNVENIRLFLRATADR